MAGWTTDELTAMTRPDEVQVASRRPDGSLRPYVTMWDVQADGHLYVRSAYGPDNPWFRRARASGTGRIRAGGVEHDIAFVDADPSEDDAVDAAYRATYTRYSTIVGSMVSPKVAKPTLRLEPLD